MDETTKSLDCILHVVIVDGFMDDSGILEGFGANCLCSNSNDDDNPFVKL
jgi:hypothetical protein